MIAAMKHTARRAAVTTLVVATAGAGTSCAISTQEEIEMGRQYAAEINQQLPIVEDATVNRYINSLGNSIAQQGNRDLDYTFFVVNADVVNAFAVPGGYIYVNRGLIEQTDNLSELAGVLGHEVAHVEERHGVEQMQQMQAANLGLNVAYILLGRTPGGVEQAAIEIGGGLYFAQHSREAELEADAISVRLLPRAGISPRGVVTFFRELLDERERQPGSVEQWFSTHPLTEDRITQTQQLIDQTPEAQRSGLRSNSSEYRSMKSALARYPAPPPEFREDG